MYIYFYAIVCHEQQFHITNAGFHAQLNSIFYNKKGMSEDDINGLKSTFKDRIEMIRTLQLTCMHGCWIVDLVVVSFQKYLFMNVITFGGIFKATEHF